MSNVDDLRTQVRERMTCTHCGSHVLSFRDVAREVDVSLSTVFAFLVGRGDPRPATVKAFADWMATERPFGYNGAAGVSGQLDRLSDGRPSLLTPEAGRPLVSVE